MRRKNNSLPTDVNICFVAIGLLLYLFTTCAYAYPKLEHDHKDELQHQQLQLPSRSVTTNHSKLDYGTTLHLLQPEKSRCQCTEEPNDLERALQLGPDIKLYNGRLCYCPRKSFVDDRIQRQLDHLHEAENKLRNKMSDEKIATTGVDAEKEHRRQRRHYRHYHFGHDFSQMPHNQEFGMHPHRHHHHHHHNNEFGMYPHRHHHHHHGHHSGVHCPRMHRTDSTGPIFHGFNYIPTSTETVTAPTATAEIFVIPPTNDDSSDSVFDIDLRNDFRQRPYNYK